MRLKDLGAVSTAQKRRTDLLSRRINYSRILSIANGVKR
jgi:hypothetical protein